MTPTHMPQKRPRLNSTATQIMPNIQPPPENRARLNEAEVALTACPSLLKRAGLKESEVAVAAASVYSLKRAWLDEAEVVV